MRELHVVDKLPTWVECYHKDNKRKRFFNGLSYKDVDWYKFAIIRNEKYQNSNSYIAGYFRWTGNKLLMDRCLYKVEGIYFEETYLKAIEKYEQLKRDGDISESKCREEEIWMKHSPYD